MPRRSTEPAADSLASQATVSLSALASLPSLEQLDLESTAVTDAGAARLASMRRLRYLNLRQTAVSEDAVSRLRGSLPNCRVER